MRPAKIFGLLLVIVYVAAQCHRPPYPVGLILYEGRLN